VISNKQMKLILERWDKYKLEEQIPPTQQPASTAPQAPSGVKTFGDLKKVLTGMELKRQGKLVGQKAAEYFGSLIPGVSTVMSVVKDAKDAFDFLKSVYSADDNFKSQTGLDSLNVDDNISKIVDDNVEAAFLKALMQDITKRPDNEPIGQWTATTAIQDYLARQFQQNTVKK